MYGLLTKCEVKMAEYWPTTTTTTITILYLTTLHLGAKKRSLKHVRAKTMYTINTIQYIQFIKNIYN